MADRFFPDMEAFVRFVVTVPLSVKLSDLFARGEAAQLITDEVKATIGDASKLPPPLAQSTQDERVAKGFSADETLLRTGALFNSIKWEHTSPRITLVGTDSEYAPYHEFGGKTDGRPPKRAPFARTMAEKDEEAFTVYMESFHLLFGART